MIRVVLIAFILYSSCTPISQPVSVLSVESGRIERLENFESKYITARSVDIWLPEGYSKKEEYAVLYMNDGQMLFDTSITWNKQEWGVDEVVGKLIKEGKIRKCIVVGPWNISDERHSDYFPQKPFESLSQSYRDTLIEHAKRYGGVPLFSKEVQSDNYLSFLVKELKPYIDETYSTRSGYQSTFIAGSSMGGLISMYAICEYPDVFGGAACMSTHWPGTFETKNNQIPGAFNDYMKKHLPSPETHKIYFDYGTATLDSIYEPYQLSVDSVMRSAGYSDNNWMTRKFEGADHSEVSWNRRLHVPIIFLLEEEN